MRAGQPKKVFRDADTGARGSARRAKWEEDMKHLTLAALAASMSLSAAMLVPALAQSEPNPMIFWERSGGNSGMTDRLIALWNASHPDRPIEMTYIPHAEMVPKIAQAIAAGDPPDLMGLDLIYGPQFEAAGQLTDITDYFDGDPHIATASPGHLQVGTYEGRLYGVPLYADVSALFYNKDLFRQAGLDPDSPPTSLAQLREYAEKIDALGEDIYGYYIPGSCAGCNIFTIGPLLWASGGKIESAAAGDEPLVGEDIPAVLQWLRDMHKDGLINPANRGETGETFHLQFGSGQYGMMGTGNFNITLARDQNPDMDFGIALLPGLEEGSSASFIGGDLVVIPRGSDRVDDAVDFMRWLLSDEVQVYGYAGILNMTTRTDMTDNPYFREEPLIGDVAKAIGVGQTPYTLTFFEQINSPQGPWLQMLQRVYYTDDPIDQIIADAKEQMLAISNQ